MKIERFFTQNGQAALEAVDYEQRSCCIRNADGSTVFEMDGIEAPRSWSQLASDILISKYLRKKGLPQAPGHETSARQVIHRITRSIRLVGEEWGYFSDALMADTFEEELNYVLVHQMGAFNSPVWFNLGLHRLYGIQGGEGNFRWNPETDQAEKMTNNYEFPQCSACFIQSVEDDLMSIFDLVKQEARIFKYGSGTGTNFSRIRGRQEQLSGGGTSSGLMSFLEVFDRAAGATKSGGTTRRAAKMVCLDADHPEIRDFVNWKREEEKKVRALIAEGYSNDFNGEAYHTVSGQNSNNSIRLSDAFMRAWERGENWQTRLRTTGDVCESFPARDLMRDICESAWECADPGVQFDSTINNWHTCPESGAIHSSNPCSEYMFVDDSACNLASINLMEYLKEDGTLDLEAFRHTVRLFILAQDILVDASSYPTARIARNSHYFRPLGLGYANLGALIMANGLPYDSEEGRALAGAITAILTGESYAASAELAEMKSPFREYSQNQTAMLKVMEKHRAGVNRLPQCCPDYLREAARQSWDRAIEKGQTSGYRNAQVTVLAPTGTIGLLMDCDTTGIEPDFALVKFKKLAGGGYFKIVNHTVSRALKRLGYEKSQIREILEYLVGTQRLEGAPHVNPENLGAKGMTVEDLKKVEAQLPRVFDLEQAFSPWVLGTETMARLELSEALWQKPGFSLLRHLGFTPEQIREAELKVCGAMTVEGAPYLAREHYAVFDCAGQCGKLGTRIIAPMGHVRMMAAVQPFLSGAISKTVNLPHDATVQEIEDLYVTAWRMGLKAVALYRDGCKMSQPLNVQQDEKKESEDEQETAQLELFPELAPPGPKRRRLPSRRKGITVEAKVAGHKVFLRTGEYENGELGEVFIDMHKEGSAFRSMMMCFAIAVSKGLQYGVPLQKYVDTFVFTNFEPKGICSHPNIKMVSSVIDYVFRVLGLEYLGRTDLCHVKPENLEELDDEDDREEPPVSLEEGPDGMDEVIDVEAEAPARSLLTASGASQAQENALGRQLREVATDAPFCDICGHITVRNGTCYKCLNCGNSMGCS